MKNIFKTLCFTLSLSLFAGYCHAYQEKVELDIPQGKLTITPMSQTAIRFQLTNEKSSLLPEYVYIESSKRVKFSSSENSGKVTVKVDRMSVEVDKNSGDLVVKDSEGKPIFTGVKMSLSPAEVQGKSTQKAVLSFFSPDNEFINGLGEFQDGYLNVRGLSRRLTQVNTQISVPMIISDRGYGLQWNNYGLTDFNPCTNSVTLVRSNSPSKKSVVDQTTGEGNQKAEILSNTFQGELNIEQDGDYALLLDMGQKMARTHNLIIDEDTVIDMHNIWLPPTTSKIYRLKKGVHKLTCQADRGDTPTLFFKKIDNTTTFSSPVAQAVDFTLYIGKPENVISSYREITGKAPLMPLWALGYIHCRERFHSQDEILKTAKRFRDENYPIDMIVQDWQYWGNNGWNAMKFDEKAYPDPKLLVDSLHRDDIRLMLSVWSKIDLNSEVGKEMAANGYFIPNTTWVDFFNPEAAKRYWKEFSQRLLMPYGIDAWWQDATEPENDDLQNRYVAGNTIAGEVYRNIYPLFVNKTVYEGSINDRPDRRAMILTRCGFSGIQRYGAAVWSGDVGNDFETLRRQITAGLGLISTGLPWWTYDAGGFFRPQNQYVDKDYHERLIRWLQISTFLPLMRVHGYMSNTEFWNYGPEVEKVAHKYLDLRYRMLPYIYNQAHEVSENGGNMMRTMMMAFTDDKEALDKRYQFMFGPSLLVAPVVSEGAKEWPVYLPKNGVGWVDFFNGTQYEDGVTIHKGVELEDIPVFVQRGSIIALTDSIKATTQLNSSPIEIRVYPGADASTKIYNDNGVDFAYKSGEFSNINIVWNDKERKLIIGKREGKFENMAKEIPMKIIIVEGKGADSCKSTSIIYKGKKIEVKF